MLRKADTWKEYELLDAGDGQRLERWNDIILIRPDPLAIWPKGDNPLWEKADALYHRSKEGGGHWEYRKKIPETWLLHYRDLTFKVAPTGFKHTGIFPEQAVNWDWLYQIIKSHEAEEIRVLNLFAYTGAASLVCAKAGASEVVHVDAAKGMVQWAEQNRDLSHLQNSKIRFIVDDCLKFVKREKRRGRTYQGIMMDPPSYGRGPDGELWKFEKEIPGLIDACMDIMDNNALFFLINSYTAGISSVVIENLLRTLVLPRLPSGKSECGEVVLPASDNRLYLPCGIYGRWLRQ